MKDDLQTREQGKASLKDRLESRIAVEKACGNCTESPMNHVRIMMDALTRISELEEALRPFADSDIDVSGTAAIGITASDILRARATLDGAGEKG